ncbi:MAG: hypothetical protein U0263_41395 [Polyangiaceae bacterium]
MAVVTIKPGHVQPIWAGHPWVYAQAVARISGGATPGDEVEVVDDHGNALGRGLYSPGSAIVVRLYTRDRTSRIDSALIERRIAAAVARRQALELPSPETNAYRVVHAEGDDVPGLVVDRYGDVLVVQIGTIGIKKRQQLILDSLASSLSPRAILDRSSERAAKNEGFEAGRGVVFGDSSVNELAFSERGLSFRIPFELGQKTGFYVDQRPLRARVEALAHGRRVLDTFTYVGAIALAAARGGASRGPRGGPERVGPRRSRPLQQDNQLSSAFSSSEAGAHDALALAGRREMDTIWSCATPKLAPTRAAKKRALGAMRRLAAAGARATRPGGLLVLCSCSAAIGVEELTRAAALGGRRDVGDSSGGARATVPGCGSPGTGRVPRRSLFELAGHRGAITMRRAIAACIALLLLATAAQAQEPRRVVLVVSAGAEEQRAKSTLDAIRAQLGDLPVGLVVTPAESAPKDLRERLDFAAKACKENGAVGAFFIELERADDLLLYLIEPEAKRALVRRVQKTPGAEQAGAEELEHDRSLHRRRVARGP